MSEVIIYGIPGSPYVRSALLGAAEKGVPYRLAPLAMGGHRSEAHLARHPFARVPTLEHDGFALYETQAILRYLDAAFPGPRLEPADPKQAARMNQVIGVVDWYLFPGTTATIGWNRIMAPKFGMPVDEALIAKSVPKAQLCLGELGRLLGDTAFMAGPDLTLADLMLAPQIDYLETTPECGPIIAATGLGAWINRMRARPSMRATHVTELLKAA